jgi:PAS domain S-box-containing protein
MLESFLSDFSFIKETLDKEGAHDFFGKNFSFFSAEPILFYNSERDAIVYMNSRFADEFNYTVEDLADWKYSIYPLLSGDDQEAFRECMRGLLDGIEEGCNVVDGKYRLIAKNKTHSYYRVKVRRLHKAYYFIQLENAEKSAIPVLKNKTADELISDAEIILKFGFWMWDIPTDKVFWTKGMYQLLEFDEMDQVKPSNSFDGEHVIKDDVYLEFEKRFKAGQVKDSYRNKYRVKTNTGKVLTVSEHGKIEYDADGKPLRVIGLTRDITLQEQSMKSLSDYKSMMQENETFLNYGTWESDAEGNNIVWTEGMYKIFGYDEKDRDELPVNRELYARHIIDPDKKDIEAIRSFLENKNDYQQELEIKDKQGAVKILSTYAKIIRNNESGIEKIIGTTRDVTQLKEYEKILESKIEELNRSNRELEEFAYVASHDMQEPLRKISTFVQRLQNKFGEGLDDDGRLYITRILASSENMRNLINNLLEFSRISRNKHPAEKVDLSATLNGVLTDLELEIEETGSKINVPELPVIEAIPTQMAQLFFNLLSNAIKFRKKDAAPVINIEQHPLTEQEKQKYQLPAATEYCMITVSDNGIGFEQLYAEKIFQLFQRLQGKFEFPGSGIGLSICKKIVSNHNGQIFASAEPGKGSKFFIILPKQQP